MALAASFPVHIFEEKESSKVCLFHHHTPGAIFSQPFHHQQLPSQLGASLHNPFVHLKSWIMEK